MTRDDLVVDHLSMARAIGYRFQRSMPRYISAEDLAQEAAIVMLQVVRSRPEEWDDLANYAFTAAYRHMLTILQYERRMCRNSDGDVHCDLDRLEAAAPPAEAKAIVSQLLARISEADREVLIRRFWLEESTAEIADGSEPFRGVNKIHGALRRCRMAAHP